MKSKIAWAIRCVLIFTASLATGLAAGELRLPSFLPDYYRPIFATKDLPLVFRASTETNGVTQFIYTVGANEALSVESIASSAPGRSVLNNILGHLNRMITTNSGRFTQVTETEIQAEVVLTNMTQSVFALVMPHSVHIWTHSVGRGSLGQFQSGFQDIVALAQRQRYEEALKEGNVELGRWQESIHKYAEQLLKAGMKPRALQVYDHLLTTSPYDYQAHLELVENTIHPVAATNSAKVVFKRAEDCDQINAAARFLGVKVPDLQTIIPLSTNDTGFKVILIPIAPCNPWLLDEVAKTYERITDVPVQIRRLEQKWTWNPPDRIARQRDIESILVRLTKTNIVFTGWTGDRFFTALTEAVEPEDAYSKYCVNDLILKARSEPGQYRVEPYLEAFCEKLRPFRSSDTRTMYVGITEANIYGGDNNFVFSLGSTDEHSHASLMSYYMMMGKAIPQGFDSRQRLVERMAKELVPASLKQIRIPRSTDPTCPYSYSSGLDRLDQKTLTLSDEVKLALSKLKNAP